MHKHKIIVGVVIALVICILGGVIWWFYPYYRMKNQLSELKNDSYTFIITYYNNINQSEEKLTYKGKKTENQIILLEDDQDWITYDIAKEEASVSVNVYLKKCGVVGNIASSIVGERSVLVSQLVAFNERLNITNADETKLLADIQSDLTIIKEMIDVKNISFTRKLEVDLIRNPEYVFEIKNKNTSDTTYLNLYNIDQSIDVYIMNQNRTSMVELTWKE